MPYIKQYKRPGLLSREFLPMNVGELNFVITAILNEYVSNNSDEPGYNEFNGIVGVLECCKLEFYRRAIAAYEDQKIKENGDVYDS